MNTNNQQQIDRLASENKALKEQNRQLREALVNLLDKMGDAELIHYAINKATAVLSNEPIDGAFAD